MHTAALCYPGIVGFSNIFGSTSFAWTSIYVSQGIRYLAFTRVTLRVAVGFFDTLMLWLWRFRSSASRATQYPSGHRLPLNKCGLIWKSGFFRRYMKVNKHFYLRFTAALWRVLSTLHDRLNSPCALQTFRHCRRRDQTFAENWY